MKKIDQRISSHLKFTDKTPNQLNPYRIKPKHTPLGIWVDRWCQSPVEKKRQNLSGRVRKD